MMRMPLPDLKKMNARRRALFDGIHRNLRDSGLYPTLADSDVIDTSEPIRSWRNPKKQEIAATPAFKVSADGTIHIIMYGDIQVETDKWDYSNFVPYPTRVRRAVVKLIRSSPLTENCRIRFTSTEQIPARFLWSFDLKCSV